MINYDSILSAFDGKPTLLQWLKLVKKALDESVLKDITLKQDGANVVFTFNFEDGTSISTPAATLPKGDTGAKGDKGEQGVSVTGVDEVSNEVVGGQTLTTLRFNFSNGTNNEVVVHAENGKNAIGGGKLYKHELSVEDQSSNLSITFIYYSTQNTVISTYDSFVQALREHRVEPLVFSTNPLTQKTTIGTYSFTSTDSSFTIVVTGFIGDNTSVVFGQTSMTITASDRYYYTDKLTEL